MGGLSGGRILSNLRYVPPPYRLTMHCLKFILNDMYWKVSNIAPFSSGRPQNATMTEPPLDSNFSWGSLERLGACLHNLAVKQFTPPHPNALVFYDTIYFSILIIEVMSWIDVNSDHSEG